MSKNPYIRIMEAYATGTGVKLSPDEVWHMAQDSAIETVAANIIEGIPVGIAHFHLTKEGFEAGPHPNGNKI